MTIPPKIGWVLNPPLPLLSLVPDPPHELLAEQQLDGAVELTGEPRGGILANLAHPLVECGRRELGVTVDLALGDPFEPLGLPALELDQRQLQPRPGIDLCLLDSLGDRGLSRPKALGDLLHGATALERVRLELVERLGHGGCGRALQLLTEPDHRTPLLVVRRPELRGLALDPRLDVRDRLLLTLAQARELRIEVALGALQVVRDALKALVAPPLRRREHVGQCLARPKLALHESRAALVS